MRDIAKFFTHSVSDTMFIDEFRLDKESNRCTFFLTNNHGVSYPVRAKYDAIEGVYRTGGTRFLRGNAPTATQWSFETSFVLVERDGLYTIYGEWVETDGVHRDDYMYKIEVEV